MPPYMEAYIYGGIYVILLCGYTHIHTPFGEDGCIYTYTHTHIHIYTHIHAYTHIYTHLSGKMLP